MAAKVDKGVDPADLLSAAFTDPRTQRLVTRELGKTVLSRGAWATVMFLIQDLDAASGNYRAPKISVRRYKRAGQAYKFHSAFSISGEKQARAMVDVVQQWFGAGGPGREALDALGDLAHVEHDE
jgi:2-hydroxychromene-2-carboxylate isomerase